MMLGVFAVSLLVPLLVTTFPTVVPRLKSTEIADKFSAPTMDFLARMALWKKINNLNDNFAQGNKCWYHQVPCKRGSRAAHMELFDYVTKPKTNVLFVGPPAITPNKPGKSSVWKALIYNDTEFYAS